MSYLTKPTFADRLAARRLLAADPGRACTSCKGSGQMPSWEHGPDFVDGCTHCDSLGIEPS